MFLSPNESITLTFIYAFANVFGPIVSICLIFKEKKEGTDSYAEYRVLLIFRAYYCRAVNKYREDFDCLGKKCRNMGFNAGYTSNKNSLYEITKIPYHF